MCSSLVGHFKIMSDQIQFRSDIMAGQIFFSYPILWASLQIWQEFLPRMFENVSRSLKYDSIMFLFHKHIIYNMDTNKITLPCSLAHADN